MKDRVCFLGNGRSVYLQQFCNRFVELGWDVHLITWRNPESMRYNKKVQIHKIFSPPHSFLIFLAVLEVALLLRRIKPDIIHAHYINTFGIVAALVKHIFPYPLVVSAWGPHGIRKSRGIRRALIKHTFQKADRVLTTSDYLRKVIIEEFHIPGKKITAIPWGINLQLFSPKEQPEINQIRKRYGLKSTDFVVLSPRNLEPVYRIENIVEGFSKVHKKHPKVKLLMLKGYGKTKDYEEMILNKIQDNDVREGVFYIPHLLSRDELAEMYAISDILVSVPLNDQFSSCIQEGIACGAVPITKDLDVYKMYLKDGENALFAKKGKPKNIADKIIYCMKHPELKKQFYEKNRKIIEEYENWGENSKKIENVYKEVLSK